mmetsp:Transcript_84453/g.222678  ORF Transcript_84453/g.222678 Transcript_84453/m.222678 type:complete len:233 (+) Transcript_84453:270-968(+)
MCGGGAELVHGGGLASVHAREKVLGRLWELRRVLLVQDVDRLPEFHPHQLRLVRGHLVGHLAHEVLPKQEGRRVLVLHERLDEASGLVAGGLQLAIHKLLHLVEFLTEHLRGLCAGLLVVDGIGEPSSGLGLARRHLRETRHVDEWLDHWVVEAEIPKVAIHGVEVQRWRHHHHRRTTPRGRLARGVQVTPLLENRGGLLEKGLEAQRIAAALLELQGEVARALLLVEASLQ